jgi:hypothetical protein
MANPSLALEKQQPEPSHDETAATVVNETVEQCDENSVCAATVRYLSDVEVNALREEVLHHDFMNA